MTDQAPQWSSRIELGRTSSLSEIQRSCPKQLTVAVTVNNNPLGKTVTEKEVHIKTAIKEEIDHFIFSKRRRTSPSSFRSRTYSDEIICVQTPGKLGQKIQNFKA